MFAVIIIPAADVVAEGGEPEVKAFDTYEEAERAYHAAVMVFGMMGPNLVEDIQLVEFDPEALGLDEEGRCGECAGCLNYKYAMS